MKRVMLAVVAGMVLSLGINVAQADSRGCYGYGYGVSGGYPSFGFVVTAATTD